MRAARRGTRDLAGPGRCGTTDVGRASPSGARRERVRDRPRSTGGTGPRVGPRLGPGAGAGPTAAETTTLVNKYDLGRYIVGTDAKSNTFDSFIGKRSGYGGARIAIAVKPGNIIGQVGQIDEESEIRSALGLK